MADTCSYAAARSSPATTTVRRRKPSVSFSESSLSSSVLCIKNWCDPSMTNGCALLTAFAADRGMTSGRGDVAAVTHRSHGNSSKVSSAMASLLPARRMTTEYPVSALLAIAAAHRLRRCLVLNTDRGYRRIAAFSAEPIRSILGGSGEVGMTTQLQPVDVVLEHTTRLAVMSFLARYRGSTLRAYGQDLQAFLR